MDVAWKLGTGSELNDWELRMSLRSFAKHYQSDSRPWIIGHIPRWIDRELVRCIEWPDPHPVNKDANLLGKVVRLALEPELSDPYILCSDDQMLLQDMRPEDFQHWHQGEIPHQVEHGMSAWNRKLVHTGRQLRMAGFPAVKFDSHVPMPLLKAWSAAAVRFHHAELPGMTLFSTLLNFAGIKGEHLESKPRRARLESAVMTKDQIDEEMRQKCFLNLTPEAGRNQQIIQQIEALFPHPEPWEKDAKR